MLMTRHFCWHQNFVPWGAVCPCLGAIYMYKIMKKKLYKIRFLWNLQQMGKVIRHFYCHQNFVPWGKSVAALGLYTWIKSWQNCIKSDFKEIFLKLATNDRSDKMFLLTSIFHPQGVVSACAGAIYMYKIMKNKLCKIRLQREFFETCSKWPKWQEVSVDIKTLSPGIVCPWPAANIHLSNHEKMCIKSEVEEIIFKLATNNHSDGAFLLRSKCWP